ncbi:MAG: transglutaminase domain-containing protein [Lachnospiraceae bacterium]|nr:transglutaminase domain-containing protein [Lachnospiraceae bacterium]
MKIASDVFEKTLYRSINTTLLSCVIIYDIGRIIGIFAPRVWYIALCFLLSMVTCLLARQLKLKKGFTILVTLIVAIAMIMIIGIRGVIDFFKTYANWALSMPGWKAEWMWAYQIIQVLWVVLVAYGVQYLFEKSFKVRIGFTGIIICLLGYYMITAYQVKYVGVVINVCFIAQTLIEWTEQGWSKKKRRNTQEYMLWMLPFVVVYFLLMMKMPISSEPYDWKYVKAAYKYIQEKVTVWVNDIFGEEDEYDLALSGFSQEGDIGDGVAENNKEIMTLETNRKMQTNVYLTGKIFNTFEGLSWKAYQEEKPKDRYIDTIETLYAAMQYDPGYLYNYAIKSRIKISYKDLNTDYLFAPLKSSSVEGQWEQIDFQTRDGSTYFNENYKYGSWYNVYFYQVNADADLFYDFLDADVKYDVELWNKVLSDFKAATGIDLTYEEIVANREKYYQYYMEQPKLSNKVMERLDFITKDAETDIEVLRAIEKELASYTYTKTPGKLPENVVDDSTFLDYFMFESKQGYCTHYATAFTLLARAKGYPARYVQGYCVPMLGEKTATVTGSMAHAWPEVYIEDVGWIAFEPTPGYGEIRYTPWTTKRITNTDNYFGEDFYSEEETYFSTPTDVEDIDKEESDSKLDKALDVVKKLIIIIPIGFILIVFVVRLVGKLQNMKKTEKERYYWKVKRNLRLLEIMGYVMEDTETLAEFLYRIQREQKLDLKLNFIRTYEEIIYGDKEIDEGIMSELDNEYTNILAIYKDKSKPRYIWYVFWNDVG